MTGPEDGLDATRPISVSELLAKNGTGAAAAGGRRRRRRGNTDAVTVAELSGEIPIIALDTTHDDGSVEPAEPATGNEAPAEVAEAEEAATVTEMTPNAIPGDPTHGPADVGNVEAQHAIQARQEQPQPLGLASRPRRTHYTHALRPAQKNRTDSAAPQSEPSPIGAAEQMSPDPVVDDDDVGGAVDVAESADLAADHTLFGGHTGAEELTRRDGPGPEDIDLEDATDADNEEGAPDEAPAATMSAIAHGAWIVGQSVIAVLFGAGLFIAFDQLWKWNVIVAMLLAVLVILGLVAGVRVVRKTEDIGTTLIAIVVGALITFGPLTLQSV